MITDALNQSLLSFFAKALFGNSTTGRLCCLTRSAAKNKVLILHKKEVRGVKEGPNNISSRMGISTLAGIEVKKKWVTC